MLTVIQTSISTVPTEFYKVMSSVALYLPESREQGKTLGRRSQLIFSVISLPCSGICGYKLLPFMQDKCRKHTFLYRIGSGN